MFALLQGNFICFEEPETALHPKFQSLMAKAFVHSTLESYEDKSSGVSLRSLRSLVFLETHSEYFIRALQLEARNLYKPSSPEEGIAEAGHIEITYFEVDESSGEFIPRPMGLRRDGMLKQSFGPGFFDESYRLTSLLLSDNYYN